VTVSRSRTLGAAPEGIWRILIDPDQLPRWWPGVQRVEDVSPGAWTKVLRAPKAGKAVRADYSLEEADPLSRMVWRHEVEESPFERLMSQALYQFDLEPQNGDTRVKITARLRLRGLSRLGSLQVRRATARRLEEALDGLEGVVL
jgi:carbon monoxide dehydrogenase subunit G